MDIQSYIIQKFEHNIEQEGSFWRLARLDTFIDLLILHAGKVSKIGLNDELATEIILIAVKALVNGRLGVKEYIADYKRLNKELFHEQEAVRVEVERILSYALLKADVDEPNYFKVLSDLKTDNFTLDVFERILISFLGYIRSL